MSPISVPLRAVCGSFFTIIATEVLAESMVLALFADDDPCAPVEPDPQIPRIGTVYDLSAVPATI
jgi:hypothetical protein